MLADINGKPSEQILRKALAKFKEARKQLDVFTAQIGVMEEIERKNKAIPEHIEALGRILQDHPALERVSLTNSRFANVNKGTGITVNTGSVGNDFGDLLKNIKADAKIVAEQYDQLIQAFVPVIPLGKSGGFAAMVLSGRAPLPEKVMHNVDQLMVFVQFVDRACTTSIAADMQVYPKGLEWLPKVDWKK